jgi:hypothetical protein
MKRLRSVLLASFIAVLMMPLPFAAAAQNEDDGSHKLKEFDHFACYTIGGKDPAPVDQSVILYNQFTPPDGLLIGSSLKQPLTLALLCVPTKKVPCTLSKDGRVCVPDDPKETK